MAIAPADFGKFAGDLLVGNFGDGTINAFNLKNDKFVGTLDGVDGKPITIGDLWALTPGNGGRAGSTGEIFFTYLKGALLGGFVIALPEVLWQAWAFISPGLYASEKKFALPFVTVSTLLFVSGALFGHQLVFPIMFALISANIVNLIGDWALIYGHLGFRPMGIEGSGWSTCAARAVTGCSVPRSTRSRGWAAASSCW